MKLKRNVLNFSCALKDTFEGKSGGENRATSSIILLPTHSAKK
jgi:hypothetical protein